MSMSLHMPFKSLNARLRDAIQGVNRTEPSSSIAVVSRATSYILGDISRNLDPIGLG